MYPKFELNRIKKVIQWNGNTYTAVRQAVNDSHEPIDGENTTTVFKGIFHEVAGHVVIASSENARVKAKPQPEILGVYDEVKGLILDDKITLSNGIVYKVVDVKDLGNFGIIGSISLEVET
jgi:hypothetical protein